MSEVLTLEMGTSYHFCPSRQQTFFSRHSFSLSLSYRMDVFKPQTGFQVEDDKFPP